MTRPGVFASVRQLLLQTELLRHKSPILIEPLESALGGALQDRLLSVHHAYTQTFARSHAVRIIENHLGVATAFILDPPRA